MEKPLFNFCKQQNIDLSADKENSYLCTVTLKSQTIFLSHISLDKNPRGLHVKTILPIKVPKSRRQSVAELIIRVNHNQILGNFDWDMGSDEIYYKTSIIVGRGDLHPDMVNQLFLSNWGAADKYLPAFTAVIFKNLAPTTAIVLIDSNLVNGGYSIL